MIFEKRYWVLQTFVEIPRVSLLVFFFYASSLFPMIKNLNFLEAAILRVPIFCKVINMQEVPIKIN